MKASIILLLSALAAFGQTAFLYDIASFQSFEATSPCTAGTNNVQWTPTNSIVTWQGVVGSGSGQYQYQFNTNPICDILAVQLNDVINTVTNVNTLTNLRAFECIASDGSTNRSVDLSNLSMLTNAQVSYFTNLHYVDITGCKKIFAGNFSQNGIMTNVVGWSDSTNWNFGNGLVLNDDFFSRNSQSNIIWTATNMTVVYGMSGWQLRLDAQFLSAYTETLDAVTTANNDYGCNFTVTDLQTPGINTDGGDLLNAHWKINWSGGSASIRCNTNTATVYIEYSSDDVTYSPKRNLAFPGYDVLVAEDMTGMPNPCYLAFYVYDSEVNRNSPTASSNLYSDPPP